MAVSATSRQVVMAKGRYVFISLRPWRDEVGNRGEGRLRPGFILGVVE